MHRETSAVHDLGSENWHNCTRAQRIRKGIPSKLTLTMFGQTPSTESMPVPGTESMPNAVPSSAPVEPSAGAEPTSAARASGSQNLPLAVHARSSNTVCEGWATPPVPLHGPKFRLLKDSEKQDLIEVHKNLGHPGPSVLSQHLKLNGAEEHIVEAAREYICDACVETSKFKHQQPAKLHEPREFNELVGIDGFFSGLAAKVFRSWFSIASTKRPCSIWDAGWKTGIWNMCSRPSQNFGSRGLANPGLYTRTLLVSFELTNGSNSCRNMTSKPSFPQKHGKRVE